MEVAIFCFLMKMFCRGELFLAILEATASVSLDLFSCNILKSF